MNNKNNFLWYFDYKMNENKSLKFNTSIAFNDSDDFRQYFFKND
jgi:hypothetical protein